MLSTNRQHVSQRRAALKPIYRPDATGQLSIQFLFSAYPSHCKPSCSSTMTVILPPEIILYLIKYHAEDTSTLSQLCLVSKWIGAEAQKALYRSVAFEDPHDPSRHRRFLQSLESFPRLLSMVHAYSAVWPPLLSTNDNAHFLCCASAECRDNLVKEEQRIRRLIPLVIPRLGRLSHIGLRIRGNDEPQHEAFYQDVVGIFSRPGSFRHLSSFTWKGVIPLSSLAGILNAQDSITAISVDHLVVDRARGPGQLLHPHALESISGDEKILEFLCPERQVRSLGWNIGTSTGMLSSRVRTSLSTVITLSVTSFLFGCITLGSILSVLDLRSVSLSRLVLSDFVVGDEVKALSYSFYRLTDASLESRRSSLFPILDPPCPSSERRRPQSPMGPPTHLCRIALSTNSHHRALGIRRPWPIETAGQAVDTHTIEANTG